MATKVRNTQELIDLYIDELQNQNPDLTDTSEGSILDQLAGTTAYAVNEAVAIIVDRFSKTYFGTAEGQDLEDLAVDHFGNSFARPGPQKSVGIVTFSRPNTTAGDVEIEAGTIVRTATDANGNSTQFETTVDTTLAGTSISVSVQALVAGPAGNVSADKVTVIETALTDSSVTVNNDDAMSGGANTESDSEYRETIRELIEQLPGATILAIEAKAKTVSGVVTATILETWQYVRDVDANGDPIGGDAYQIPTARLYIADANGVASDALISLVEDAIESVRAAGVRIIVEEATTLELDWTAALTLNSGGPNFAELSADPQRIIDSMTQYVSELAVGTDFDVSVAETAILDIWGPAGTDDLTAGGFTTSVPAGDVAVAANEKLIPGDILIS